MTHFEKAEVLTKYFNIYGQGNFDLSLEEIAQILAILEKKELSFIEVNLKEMYERLEKIRLG